MELTQLDQVQNPTPWSDGVPGLTQCPILPGQTFRFSSVDLFLWNIYRQITYK